MRREQKTEQLGYLCDNRVELDERTGAQSIVNLGNEVEDGTELLARVLHRDNMNLAYKRVKQNDGAAGIDGMTVGDMLAYLQEHGKELIEKIQAEKYKPQPVRRVEIPKPDGGTRQLGIPTVIDRMIQQALVQVLQPIFEKSFSDNSYGFRPGRNARQAINKAKEYYEQGYTEVVDIDLEKYFDTVNHDLLIEMIRSEIKDEAVIRLIRKYLKSGIMENGVANTSDKGTPQGGNLSPLLSNIYLTKFDREMEKRGHKFVRYADDCNIYVKTQRAADRVMSGCINYLEGKLKLKVNTTKSATGSPLKRKFLGFKLSEKDGKTDVRVHEKPLRKFKERVKAITSRSRGRRVDTVLKELKIYTTGWLGYFSTANLDNELRALNGWIRRRLRMYIWKQWKKISARFRKLKTLGVKAQKAWEWANTRRGSWVIARSPIMQTTLTNERLKSLGYDDVLKRYERLCSIC